MGETFVGERTGPGGVVQRVRVKRLVGEDADDPKLIQDFQHEARLVANLCHQNLVGFHELGVDRGVWWMALELVDGIDLRALISQRRASGERLPVEVVVHIAVELAKALSYAHAARLSDGVTTGIVHRDVSPSNVLLSREGEVSSATSGSRRRSTITEREPARSKGRGSTSHRSRCWAT
jgi:serine/threonine protein kinase